MLIAYLTQRDGSEATAKRGIALRAARSVVAVRFLVLLWDSKNGNRVTRITDAADFDRPPFRDCYRRIGAMWVSILPECQMCQVGQHNILLTSPRYVALAQAWISRSIFTIKVSSSICAAAATTLAYCGSKYIASCGGALLRRIRTFDRGGLFRDGGFFLPTIA
jgi:hypothetical protein